MAQKWRKRPDGQKSAPRPLNAGTLESLALAYVGRFATSRAKLIAYLRRKLRERGWEGEEAAPMDQIADRLVALRYVDDEAYATMKSGAMQRRGLGRRRITQALRQDGISEELSGTATPDAVARWEAADRLARRKRIGPYASDVADRPTRETSPAYGSTPRPAQCRPNPMPWSDHPHDFEQRIAGADRCAAPRNGRVPWRRSIEHCRQQRASRGRK
jgi:regulatory protein